METITELHERQKTVIIKMYNPGNSTSWRSWALKQLINLKLSTLEAEELLSTTIGQNTVRKLNQRWQKCSGLAREAISPYLENKRLWNRNKTEIVAANKFKEIINGNLIPGYYDVIEIIFYEIASLDKWENWEEMTSGNGFFTHRMIQDYCKFILEKNN